VHYCKITTTPNYREKNARKTHKNRTLKGS
jgi:hypothetical protein